MSELCFRGSAWVFGDHIDTDQIVSGPFLNATIEEQSRHVFGAIRPEFCTNFRPGGIIVAGANFGCGSSRDSAAEVLKHLEVAAVVAESFARIFFRNAIAIGLPVVVCPGIVGVVAEGDLVEVDVQSATVSLSRQGRTLAGASLNAMMLRCLQAGGLMKLLSEDPTLGAAHKHE